jgi:hypothetical protein
MMTDHVSWEPLSAINGRGVKSYGAAVDILCYWEEKLSTVWILGQMVSIGGILYCGGVFHVDGNDRLTLPNGKTPEIVKVEQFKDENGPYATVITVGR